jgi:ribosomal protein L12E/L44/L45/RPP1/RPP2
MPLDLIASCSRVVWSIVAGLDDVISGSANHSTHTPLFSSAPTTATASASAENNEAAAEKETEERDETTA